MWTVPKTDWKAADFFNIEDYNRIKNNLNHIRDTALELYSSIPYEDMGEDKTYSDYYYADEINLIESNLESINTNTFPRNIGENMTFYDNQPFINCTELNRIENGIFVIYKGMYGHITGRRRLAFQLGRRRVV
jgi:hypothetical protein